MPKRKADDALTAPAQNEDVASAPTIRALVSAKDATEDHKVLADYKGNFYLAFLAGSGKTPENVNVFFDHPDPNSVFLHEVPIARVFKLPEIPYRNALPKTKAAALDLVTLVTVREDGGDYKAAEKIGVVSDGKKKDWLVRCLGSGTTKSVAQAALEIVYEGTSARRDVNKRDVWPEQDLLAEHPNAMVGIADGTDKLVRWSPDGAYHKAAIIRVSEINLQQGEASMYDVVFYGRDGELLHEKLKAQISEIADLLTLPSLPDTEDVRKEMDKDPKSFSTGVYVLGIDVKADSSYLPAKVLGAITEDDMSLWEVKFVFGDCREALLSLDEMHLMYADSATKLDRHGMSFFPTDVEHNAFIQDTTALGADQPELPVPYTDHICTDVSEKTFCEDSEEDEDGKKRKMQRTRIGWRDITQLAQFKNKPKNSTGSTVTAQRQLVGGGYVNGTLDASNEDVEVLVEWKAEGEQKTVKVGDVSKVYWQKKDVRVNAWDAGEKHGIWIMLEGANGAPSYTVAVQMAQNAAILRCVRSMRAKLT
ncbi:hypothetical protein LTR85_000353 [Meristemomyces frigidus]|nr:hypothetical protein LTR85_000353 [Meristemomyces frigidus]